MKTLYIDCSMGVAGDMLTAALLELLPDKDGFIKELNDLGIPDVSFDAVESVKCGIKGTHVSVKVHGVEEESHDAGQGHHEHDEHGHDEHGHDEHDHDDYEHDDHEHHEHDHEEHEHHEHDHHNHDRHDHNHDHHHPHTHHHSSMHDIEHIVRDHIGCSDKVKEDVLAVYRIIADAESHVHGVPVTDIHFHEVGTLDAVADITAVCMLMERLGCDNVVVSPIHVGSGQVRCAHGILPVPAPATAFILNDIPIYGGKIRGELCTPTGAALLKHFATKFGDMPAMKVSGIGYGMGKKDFEAANCVRVFVGDSAVSGTSEGNDTADSLKKEVHGACNEQSSGMLADGVICELSCNIDDMTGEEIGFAMDRLFEAGALEVYTVPVGMKKNRPGILLSVMCREEDKEKMIVEIFKNTTTLGIRENIFKRYTLDRRVETVSTSFGNVRIKKSSGYGVNREKAEFEDLAAMAVRNGISLRDMRKKIDNGK
ncbi:MAG: nickel pincer cofactor biosynthesis protein LarC [Lachnospiraceae bacterium]|nr:nickel pincer cofactor biosynthesis protein LarC [Lachnospiraceae bacterium]